MDVSTALSQLGESPSLEAVAPRWEESAATFPPGGPRFLTLEGARQYRELAGIEAGVDRDLARCIELIQASDALRELAWHCHQCTYVYDDKRRFDAWPGFEASLGDLGDVFYLLVTLALVPITQEVHRRLGVPEEIITQTISAPASFLDRYRRGHEGRNGVFRREVWWLRNYTDGGLFRIGRFEYRRYPFRGPVRVLRNRSTGAVIALSEEGVQYDRLGYMEAPNGDHDRSGWTAGLSVSPTAIRGFPISPRGRAIKEEVELDPAEWEERVVHEKTSMLDIHIPSGGRMTLEAVVSSLTKAAEFFSTHLGGAGFEGFYCISWVFSPHLEEILATSSNLVTLLREVYLFPVPSDPADGLFFIFSDERYSGGALDFAYLEAHRPRTTLEERIRAYILEKRGWRGGGMFILKEDVARLGGQIYRSGWPSDDYSSLTRAH